MTSTYNKLNRLKAQGRTWDALLTDIDNVSQQQFDIKTIKANATEPHREPNSHLKECVNRLHDIHFPNPYPKEGEALLALYNNTLIGQRIDHDVDSLRVVIDSLLHRLNADETLLKARLLWLKGSMCFDKIGLLRDSNQPKRLEAFRSDAIRYYSESFEILKHSISDMPFPFNINEPYKLQVNIIACHVNAVASNDRGSSEKLKSAIEKSDIVELSKNILESEPFQWKVARNALRFSSLIKHVDNIDFFYQKLAAANRRFSNVKYEPESCPSIADSADFSYAVTIIQNNYPQPSPSVTTRK